MTSIPVDVIVVILSLMPALAMFVSYPCRPSGAAGAFAAALAGAVAAAVLAAPGQLPAAAFLGAWSAAGCALALWLAGRRRADHELRHAALAEIRARREQLGKDLGVTKTRGSEVEREQKEITALYGMIKSLAEALSFDDIRPRLDAAIDQYLGVSDFAVYAAFQGAFRALTVRRLEGSPGASWATLERFLQERQMTAAQARAFDAPEAAVAVPIVDNGEVLAYLYARAPRGANPAVLLGKAQTFAAEVAFAFRRIRLFQEVEELSRIDGLTGVHRRGDFDERLRHEVVRAKTFKTTFCLMILDIDHFKQLNDRYGHPFGDQVLRRVGEVLNASVYDTDFVARYGGEEFGILLPRAEAAGAWRKAEMIRAAIEGEPFTLALEKIRVTASIGLAHFPRDAATPEELVGQADAALYRAKETGRNRVVDCQSLRST